MSKFDHLSLSPDQKSLAEAIYKFFSAKYRGTAIKIDTSVHRDLQWQPIIFLKINKHEIIACELGEEKIYPLIFRHIHNDITDIPVVIHCYSVCPDALFLDAKNQKDFHELEKHGHGMFSVDSTGKVVKRAHATPAVFHISEAQFNKELAIGLSGAERSAVVNAYDIYKNNPLSGVREISDKIEAAVNKAVKIVNQKFSSAIDENGTINNKCKALLNLVRIGNAHSSIGAVMGVYSKIRNASNHDPRNARQAYIKYRQCRENFVNGVKCLNDFKRQMKLLNIRI